MVDVEKVMITKLSFTLENNLDNSGNQTQTIAEIASETHQTVIEASQTTSFPTNT